MGAVQSTETVDGHLQSASLSTIHHSDIYNQRIGDDTQDISYGAHFSTEEDIPQYKFPETERKLPRNVDIRSTTCAPYFPAFAQHNTGSCTSHTVCAAYMCAERMIAQVSQAMAVGTASKEASAAVHGKHFNNPSVMFNYYYARELDRRQAQGSQTKTLGSQTQSQSLITDTGSSMKSSLESSQMGMAWDVDWRFDPKKINMEPPTEAQENSLHHRTVQWYKLVPSLNNIKTALFNGLPVLMSFQVLRDMDNWFIFSDRQLETGFMITSNTLTQSEEVIGGHAVLLVGYDDDYMQHGAFLARNSWGQEWGQDGHFWFQYDAALWPDGQTEFFILTNICTDNTNNKFCTTRKSCDTSLLTNFICDTIPDTLQASQIQPDQPLLRSDVSLIPLG